MLEGSGILVGTEGTGDYRQGKGKSLAVQGLVHCTGEVPGLMH